VDGDRESIEARDVSKLDRKRRVRERESGAGESFKVVDSFDDARIKRNDMFGLTLMEISKVDGGSPGSASGAESSEEGLLEGMRLMPLRLRASNQRRALPRRALKMKAIVWSAVQAEAVREREIRSIHCSAVN
jgi:hypothetical protein